MNARSAIAIFAAALLASAGANAACTTPKTTGKTTQQHKPQAMPDCVVNFNAVPEISKKIVAEEQKGQPLPKPDYAEPAPEPYTGPMVGGAGSAVGTMVRKAPEIGYKWSLD